MSTGNRRNPFVKFIVHLFNGVVDHDIASLAATIAFYAFFSLFPLLLLVIYASSFLIPHVQTEQVLLKVLQPYFPALSGTRDFIKHNLDNLSVQGRNISLISAVTLIWSATSGFIALQQALDVIWNSQQRSFLARRFISFLMLIILLLLALSTAVATSLYPLVHNVPMLQQGILAKLSAKLSIITGLSRIIFPLSLFLGCLVIYRYLPSKKVDWTYLLPGALLTMVSVDIGRALFAWYASHLSRYHIIYGTFTVVMLVVLWMYLASIAMLFGAEVSASLFALEDETE